MVLGDFMRLIPNYVIKDSMLGEMGFEKIDQLFSDIPKKIRIKNLDIPCGIPQKDLERKLRAISHKNKSSFDLLSFLGGGIKPHYIPSIVNSITSRAEFYTSYTPYQAEASQGFLQAMFEYQSLIAELTGMDIANCSLYDGFTAVSEAALLCARVTRKKTFIIPGNISWEKKSILLNYLRGSELSIKEIPYNPKTGKINTSELEKCLDDNVAGVYIENPNFFGVFESDVERISDIVKRTKALFVVGIDPISLGITKNPGFYGADIVIGEGRAFGNNMNFGGSSLGIFACKKDFLRQMPGRIIGMTTDREGNRAFSMAFQTREQHIRRGRATSNICTNEGLNALAAVVYLSWLGGNGLVELSKINYANGQKLRREIESLDGFKRVFSGEHFNEFLIRVPKDPNIINEKLLKYDIHGGFPVEKWYPELDNCLLFGISEMHNDTDIGRLIKVLEEV